MKISELKNRVLNRIKSADDQLLKLMKALTESSENQDNVTSPLSENHYKILDERRSRHLTGESESLSWEQVKKNARNEFFITRCSQ